jgi:1-acyl-sn-glycerol-3-phosphate acyltransferase
MIEELRRFVALLRAYLRFAAIALWTISLFMGLMLVLLLGPIAPGVVHGARRFCQTVWARGVAWIIGLRVIRYGAAPKRPYFLVANHLSYVDIVAISTQTPCVFVAMAEIEKWPVMGYIAKKVGTIFIDRKQLRDTKRVNQAVSEILNEGEGVLVFAESTTSTGKGVLPFRPALFETPAQREMPVHYAAIHYDVHGPSVSAGAAICWVDDAPFLAHGMKLLRLHGYTATIDFGTDTTVGNNRRTLAKETQDRVEALLRPMG